MIDTNAVRALAKRARVAIEHLITHTYFAAQVHTLDEADIVLRQCADEIDALRREIDRLRAERDDAVKKMEAGWLVVAESAMTPLIQECDTLRGQNERLRDELVATEERSRVLRELVREAHVFGSSWSIAEEWHERAEKALEGKS